MFSKTLLIALVAVVSATANAAIVNYEYSGTLFPDGVNAGTVPATATAVGTFAYNDASTPDGAGFYELTALVFTPDTASTASPLDCTDMATCIADHVDNFTRFNPTTLEISFYLNVAAQSYALWYNYAAAPTLLTGYSSNNAYGEWNIDGITQAQNGVQVSAPGSHILLGGGLLALGWVRRKRV